jgi:hypothetical protein
LQLRSVAGQIESKRQGIGGMATLVMVRTVCCETYKCTGMRCANCPNRPENKQAAQAYKADISTMTFGRRIGPLPGAAAPLLSIAAQQGR